MSVVTKHPVLTPKIDNYDAVIDDLGNCYSITDSVLSKNAVNFSGNVEEPRHRWFFYKEGYSSPLIENFLLENSISNEACVLDPFSGVGTTLLECQNRGVSSVGFDINPVAHFASIVKNRSYTNSDISEAEMYFSGFDIKGDPSKLRPSYKKFDDLFTPQLTHEMLVIKNFFEKCPNQKTGDLIKLAYLSLVGRYANRVKDGNGLKLRKNYRPPESIEEPFLNILSSYISDLRDGPKPIPNATPINICSSVLNIDKYDLLEGVTFDGAIFSPPYPNCFDYFEVYKLELWLGEFISSFGDLRPLRDVMIRSAVNCMFDFSLKNKNPEVEFLAEEVKSSGVWNERIPMMLNGYFDDMTEILKVMHKRLNQDAPVHIVVANSCYKGIIIPTDAILCRIAERIGFKVDTIERVRQIRASSQQMKEIGSNASLMRESIVKLRK